MSITKRASALLENVNSLLECLAFLRLQRNRPAPKWQAGCQIALTSVWTVSIL